MSKTKENIATINYWVFQCNPNKFDIETALKGNLLETWTVTAHKDTIKKGDKFILWLTGKKAGCVALGEISETAHLRQNTKDSALWRTVENSEWAVGIHVTHNQWDMPFAASKVKKIKALEGLIVGKQGTNFVATAEQFAVFYQAFEEKSETHHLDLPTHFPKNILLYGPPGTGKTYNSIDLAVKIATGKSATEHSENKKIFDDLREKGQIEFVTFHQNYAYEDFMVGLRPDISYEALRFQSHKGIFYEMTQKARDNYYASLHKTALPKSFDEALSEVLRPLSEEGKTVKVLMRSGPSYEITDVTEYAIHFNKPKGDSQHTLSIQTLQEIVEGIRRVSSGLASYYNPLVEVIRGLMKPKEGAKSEILKHFVLIIDEINRANISKVFGELITLLEDDKRLGGENELKITLPNGEKGFGIPPNLYVIGTMNTADKSIAMIDIALRRRFDFQAFYPTEEVLSELQKIGKLSEEKATFLRQINKEIYRKRNSADLLIGHAYFLNDKPIEAIIKTKILPLLMEYFSGKTKEVSQIFEDCGWNVVYQEGEYCWKIEKESNDTI